MFFTSHMKNGNTSSVAHMMPVLLMVSNKASVLRVHTLGILPNFRNDRPAKSGEAFLHKASELF
jgi:hypothetical protein